MGDSGEVGDADGELGGLKVSLSLKQSLCDAIFSELVDLTCIDATKTVPVSELKLQRRHEEIDGGGDGPEEEGRDSARTRVRVRATEDDVLERDL